MSAVHTCERAEGLLASKDGVGRYTELLVWQRAVELSLEIYDVTADFPRHETYGLRAQLRRSAVSVPSNIAEGQGRQSDKDFRRFLRIALGSLLELETQLHIACHLAYLDQGIVRELESSSAQLGRMLNSLSNKLRPDVQHPTSDV